MIEPIKAHSAFSYHRTEQPRNPLGFVLVHDPTGCYHPGAEFGIYEVRGVAGRIREYFGVYVSLTNLPFPLGTVFRETKTGKYWRVGIDQDKFTGRLIEITKKEAMK